MSSVAFRAAAKYLSNNSAVSHVSNDTKLELYGLFKYLTVSETPNTPRPSLFDFTGRAKWDAWSQTAAKYEDRKFEAEGRYIDIAHSLGWNGLGDLASSGSEGGDTDEEIDWDGDDDEKEGQQGGGSGMGTFVSSMGPPPSDEQDPATLHAIIISGDAEKLKDFLETHPDADPDEPDEFGYTPLHLACDRGNVAAVHVLLKKGANCDAKDPDEFTPRELARIAGHDEIVALLEKTS